MRLKVIVYNFEDLVVRTTQHIQNIKSLREEADAQLIRKKSVRVLREKLAMSSLPVQVTMLDFGRSRARKISREKFVGNVAVKEVVLQKAVSVDH